MKTLFARREKPWEHTNEIAVYYLHVAAFVTYCIYFTWAVLALLEAIPQGKTEHLFWFALTFLPLTTGAAISCLFYYSGGARWELSFDTILICVLAIFIGYNFIDYLQDHTKVSLLTNAVLDLQFAVVPLLRILYITLVTLVAGRKIRNE